MPYGDILLTHLMLSRNDSVLQLLYSKSGGCITEPLLAHTHATDESVHFCIFKIHPEAVKPTRSQVYQSTVSNYFFFLASAVSCSMAGCLYHFRSLYKAKTPKSVPYVATTNYNVSTTSKSTSSKHYTSIRQSNCKNSQSLYTVCKTNSYTTCSTYQRCKFGMFLHILKYLW